MLSMLWRPGGRTGTTVALALLALTLSLGASVAYAATISVTTVADELNADGDCSLREAIAAADTNAAVDACAAGDPGADTITFGVTGTIALARMLPIVSEGLTIDGPGAANLTISGGDSVRIFEVNEGVPLTVEDVTLTDGFAADAGGAILNRGTLVVTGSTFSGSSSESDGGAIAVASGQNPVASVTVERSTFSGNDAAFLGGAIISYAQAVVDVTDSSFLANTAGTPEGTHGGGAILNNGPLTVDGSTFSGNSATGLAGAIENRWTLTVTNSTFFDNSASDGGAIRQVIGGTTATITNSTFSENAADGYSGGITVNAGTLTLRNSIVAGTIGAPNCSGTITDGGGNLSWPDATCSGINEDPLLDPAGLADNGGPTQTIALQPESPAVDTAVAANAPPTDQRGIERPQRAGFDIGAFELESDACEQSGSTLSVALPAGSEGKIARTGTSIVVSIDGAAIGCGSPTIGNVDTIEVSGTFDTELLTLDLVGGRLEPGATPEGTGTSEIEVHIDLGAGADMLVVGGTPAGDAFRLGALGANLNADDDGDDTTFVEVESIVVNGLGGNDKLSAEGGLKTGAPLAIPIVLNGHDGNDKLTGGTANDVMNGGIGKDTCNALKVADGTDVCNGGSQVDTMSYAKRKTAVSIDPDGAADDGSAGENDTTAVDVENPTGGRGNDILVADSAGANVARGGGGNDSITVTDGIGGNDTADGGDGTDGCTADAGDTKIGCEA